MNPDEGKIITSTMQSMWPTHTWGEGEFDRLIVHLREHEFADVMAALGVLERTSRYWPHWSELSAVLGGIKRRRIESAELERQDSDPPASPERTREYIAECKRVVAAMSPQSPMKAALEKGWR